MNNNIIKLAKDWIYELLEERSSLVHKCVNCRTSNYNWEDVMKLTIAENAWYENYSKVSQLCYVLDEDMLTTFKEHFPEKREYKYLIPLMQYVPHHHDPLKIGDRVKTVINVFNTPIGSIGTIRKIKDMETYNKIEVLFDIDKCNYMNETWIAEFNLEKIEKG